MFGFTRKTDYALVALAGLADLPAGEPPRLSARQISERYGVPLPVLMNVLKNLLGGGLVRSTRGARGGYSLARQPEGISVHDVIAAIEGPISVTSCCEPETARPIIQGAGPNGAASEAGGSDAGSGGKRGTTPCPPDCRIEVRCPISSSVRRINRHIHEYLCRVTLADLMRESLQPDEFRSIESSAPRAHDLSYRPRPEEER